MYLHVSYRKGSSDPISFIMHLFDASCGSLGEGYIRSGYVKNREVYVRLMGNKLNWSKQDAVVKDK